MLTYRTGAAGVPSVSVLMANHLATETQVPELQAKLAEYYGNSLASEPGSTAAIPRSDMDPRYAERLAIDPNRPLTLNEVQNILTGLRTDGMEIEGKSNQKATQNKARISYIDLTFSAPKSVSVAFAFAPTDAERAILDRAHREAVDTTLAHIATQIGLARRGKAGSKGTDEGQVGWIRFDHYTSRPTVKQAVEENGVWTTVNQTVKVAGDPQLHTHTIIPNAVLTADGHVGGLHLKMIKDRIHEWGAVYQAYLATNLRRSGVEVELDKQTGMARLPAVPRWVDEMFSKRTSDGEEAARRYAERQGLDWERLSPEDRITLLKGGTKKARRYKGDDLADYREWKRQADEAGYAHRSVLRPGEGREPAEDRERLKAAYEASLPVLEPQLERTSKFKGALARVAAAKGLIASGIRSPDDVNAITQAYRTEGVRQGGKITSLLWGQEGTSRFASFTTELHVDQEKEAISLLKTASEDRSTDLTTRQIGRAVSKFLASNPDIDPSNEHWKKQRQMIVSLGTSGRATVGVGVAGSGKAQPDDAKVLTPGGFVHMGDIKIGSLVLCPDGTSTAVTGVFPQGAIPIFRVTFEDGRSTECCGDHLWKVWTNTSVYVRGSGRGATKKRVFNWRVKPLHEIADWFARGKTRAERTAVPLVDPLAIDFPDRDDLPVPPYALGALLGDGSMGSGSIKLTTADQDVLDRVLVDLPAYKATKSDDYTYRLTIKNRSEHLRGSRRGTAWTANKVDRKNRRMGRTITFNGESRSIKEWAQLRCISVGALNERIGRGGWTIPQALGFETRSNEAPFTSPLRQGLMAIGLSRVACGEKFIPSIYKSASVSQRLDLLRGLLDTDGSVESGTRASFTSTSHKLAKDVQEIAWSLGARSSIAERQTFCTYLGRRVYGAPSWRVSIVHPDIRQFFALPRKLRQITPKSIKHDRLRIVAIEPVGRKLARCIAVDHPDGLYVTDNYVVTHNTTLLRPLIDAWHEQGRPTYGVTLAWRQTQALAESGVGTKRKRRSMEPDTTKLVDVGIARAKTYALTAFVNSVQRGFLKPEKNSVVIIDEIAQIGTRQILDLARLQHEHGFQIVGIGDDRQCEAIEAGASIQLFRKALGSRQVPELLDTVRQERQRDRETASLFREGKAKEALARKDQDGTLHIIPGGYKESIKAAVDLWQQRRAANAGDPKYVLGISVPTNHDARMVGEEIRQRRQAAGEIGPNQITIEAADHTGGTYNLPLAEGDKVRLFKRVNNSSGRFADNGSVVEVVKVHSAGLVLKNSRGNLANVAWDDLRVAPGEGRVRLTYGDALTIDSRQGDTVTEHITVMPAGSKAVNGFKAYTADSRQRVTSWIIASQGEEMAEVEGRRPLGDLRNFEKDPSIVRATLIENIARNLSRQEEKGLALDLIGRVDRVRKGMIRSMQAAWHRVETREAQGKPAGVVPQTVMTKREENAVNQIVAAVSKQVNSVSGVNRRLAAQQATVPTVAPKVRHPVRHSEAPQLKPKASKPERKVMSDTELIADFADTLARAGFRLKGPPIMDGNSHRAQVDGDKGPQKSGIYRAHLDFPPNGFYQNYRGGAKEKWAPDVRSESMSEDQKRALQATMDAERAARTAERVAKQEAVAAIAQQRWDRAKPVADHPYIADKSMKPHPDWIRQESNGRLILPLKDENGKLWNVQTISDDGTKMYMKDGRKAGLFAHIGVPENGKPLGIAEGGSTSDAAHQLSGVPVTIAYDSPNLLPVAQAQRKLYPDSQIIIFADNDHHLPRRSPPLPNAGLEKANEAAKEINAQVIAPAFKPHDRSTDWNDAAKTSRRAAAEEMRESLAQAGIEISAQSQRRGLGL